MGNKYPWFRGEVLRYRFLPAPESRIHQTDKCINLILVPGHLDNQTFLGYVDDVRSEHIRNGYHTGSVLGTYPNLNQGKLPVHAGFRLQLSDIMDILQLTNLLLDLSQDFIVTTGNDGNTGNTGIGCDTCGNR